MKITLIKPNIATGVFSKKRYTPSNSMQPLALAVIAGLTPTGHEINFYDDRIEEIAYDEPADLVGITVDTYTAKRSYEIAQQFRRRSIPVVLGGFHPSFVPEEAMQYADSVVIGEAENLWPEILKDAERGSLKKCYRSSQRPSLCGIRPRRDIFKGKRYLPLALVEFGRGCKYACDFCATGAFYAGSYMHRPQQEVIDEIKALGKRTIFFIDDNIISDVPAAKELFKALIPLKVRWVGQASLDFANDNELMELAVKSGCYCLLIGFESLHGENLMQMGKACNIRFSDYKGALEKIRDCGIRIYATFIFGYDYDDAEIFKKTLNFALENKFFVANFNHLMPYPGTPIYQRLAKEGRLLYEKWWLVEDYRFGHAVFRPKLLSPEELTAGCAQARSEFSSLKQIFKRSLDFKANCRDIRNALEFLAYNLLSRRENSKKQNAYIYRH